MFHLVCEVIVTFDAKKKEFGRDHINVVQADMDLCAEVYSNSPCIAGRRTITLTAVSVDDFSVGNEIEGASSGAKAIIEIITGSSPTYTFTFSYIVESTGEFTTAAETINNNTLSGVGIKNTSAPILLASTGLECYNTFENCQDRPNYRPFITTGAIDIDINASLRKFTKSTGTSLITLGFAVGKKMTSSGWATNPGNNSTRIIESVTATEIVVEDGTGLVTESGSGDEVMTQPLIKTYSFCTNRSPHPTNLIPPAGDPDFIPCIRSINISPAVIDIKNVLGVRSNVAIQFNDLTHSDINIDPYPDDRVNDPLTTGTFWTKWRARYPDYIFRDLRVQSGYLENGRYLAENFNTRSYVMDKANVSRGTCQFVGKDPLKLASFKKAQAPKPSTATSDASISVGQTAITVQPVGAGDDDFGTSGECLIGREVCLYTRSGGSDNLTLTRGQRNTTAVAHDADVTVQECFVVTGQSVDVIVSTLLLDFADIDPTFINLNVWATEVSENLTGLLSGIIVKPRDINKILIELSEAKAFYLWWDELTSQIRFTALKPPPVLADVLDMSENIVKDSLKTKDEPGMRISTVIVNFGQFDPTLKLDEINNYQQSVVRDDTNSFTKYKSRVFKVINSRWLTNTNKVGALQVATLIGRRFSDTPRSIDFELDAKDSAGSDGLWIGQVRSINHRDITDRFGVPKDTVFQILSVDEKDNYHFGALEFTYGGPLTDDESSAADGFKTVRISVDVNNINLRAEWDLLYTAADNDKAKFIIESGVTVGSDLIGNPSIDTGTWVDKTGMTVKVIIEPSAHIVGKGGKGAKGSDGTGATDGGDALNLSNDITLDNAGVIGGGGAGGDRDNVTGHKPDGGGGAGDGEKGGNLVAGTEVTLLIPSEDGTTENGGVGATIFFTDAGEPGVASAEDGSDLGQDTSIKVAGKAIDLNGFTIAETGSGEGDIRGIIS